MSEETEISQDPSSDWLDELAGAAIPSSPTASESAYVPALDRERPPRAPLIPVAVWAGIAVVAAVVGVIIGIVLWSTAQSAVAVPNLVGLSQAEASTTLTREGLKIVVAEQRFSDAPRDEVLEQDPVPGTELRPGAPVEVVVSAGTEEFVMPDVTGQGLALASGTLEGKGLFVEVDYVLSDTASDTVLSSIPAPGATIRTGDRVRLQVASPRENTGQLRPFRLNGLVLVIDPAPPVPGVTNDPSLEVARRLRSLLEASGASVTMLRTGADTSTADADRAARARASSYAAGVGLSVLPDGAGGMAVSSVASLTSSLPSSSTALSSAVSTALASAGYLAKEQGIAADEVFGASETLWTRVVLGSNTSRADTALFIDPRWADAVARSIYQALGQTLGSPETP